MQTRAIPTSAASWYPKALISTSCNRTSPYQAALPLPKTRIRSRWYCKIIPDQVNAGTSLRRSRGRITAIVSFEEGVTKTVTAEELQFTAIPNMERTGHEDTSSHLQQDLQGRNCNQPVVANATFEVVEKIVSIRDGSTCAHAVLLLYFGSNGNDDRPYAGIPSRKDWK